MLQKFVKIRFKIIAAAYKYLVKPILFKMDPEFVHDRFVWLGKIAGYNLFLRWIIRIKFSYSHHILEQNVLGIHFRNPIGLAAGFDKNAQLTNILPDVGFGFEEIGSITGNVCAGNTGQRLWRFPERQSILVYYGLMNDGAKIIAKKLSGKKFRFPVGISIAKTNCQATVDTSSGIEDYIKAYRAFEGIGDYVTLNISCPNTFGGQPFTDPEKLERLLKTVDEYRQVKPIFIKMSPNIEQDLLESLVKVALDNGVDGFICSNLNKDHKEGKGGLSGKAVEALANEQLSQIYRLTNGKVPLIGCGGVFTAEDAYKKIRSGASLIQLITGMIFMGPQVIGQINQGLVELLKKDGFSNIQEAIGADIDLN